MLCQRKLSALAIDEVEQRAMGVETKRIQLVVVGLCTLLTAVIISFCGTIAFVGFIVPHLARRLVGPDFKYLLPASMAIGAVFVLLAYLVINVLFGNSGAELTGMVISVVGSVVFFATALQRGRGVQNGSFGK
jgi:iron complex transport system permease protein